LMVLVLAVTPSFLDKLSDAVLEYGIIISIVGIFSIIGVVLALDFLPNKLSNFRIIRGLYALSFEGRRLIMSKFYGIRLIIISVVIHLLSVYTVLILSKGLGITVEWLDVLLVVPVVTLFMLIPISIAGWGVREGVMVFLLGYFSVPPEQALALSILYGLAMLVVALPGGIVWFFGTTKFNLDS